MTQHTPGPWRVDPDHCRDVQTADGAIEICLAEGGEPYGKNLFSVPPMEEAHANARLIAAAPDLIAVLKELQDSASYWSEYDVPIGIVDRINAAIAKARGEK